ncbi:MAG: FAD-dependent 5-carboxymethylaminomethyl-2-thiouridine(34) oxidoreductase MnmC [Comamonas sp.]
MAEPIEWLPDGTPYSPRFGDRYHTEAAQGLAQPEQVFLQGCGLPAAWANQPQWTVLETGFGFGLNFLVTWHAWRQDPARPPLLHFVSTEAWPVAPADLLRHCAQHPQLQPLGELLAAQCWGLLPGTHRLRFDGGRVQLTLLVGDAQRSLRHHELVADSVYLDGFSPAKNPDIWSLHTLKAVARCCRPGTRLSTWCAAGEIRRDLEQCGFAVHKAQGVPPKRHNLQAVFSPAWQPRRKPLWTQPAPPLPATRRCAVIGAGIAGAATAQQLALRGWQVTVLDAAAEPAQGASGLPAGIFAPHTSRDDAVLSRLTRSGLRCTRFWAEQLLQPGTDWLPTGVLERRLGKGAHALPQAWQDDAALLDWSRPADAAVLAQAELPAGDDALWHPQGGWLRPARLVQALLAHKGIRLQGDSPVASIAWQAEDEEWRIGAADGRLLASADLVVVCAGPHSRRWLPASMDLRSIRGQVLMGKALAAIKNDATSFPINGHGSWIPRFARDGGEPGWIMGSTFERGCDVLPPTAADQQAARAENQAKLQTLLPTASQRYAPGMADAFVWAQVRCTSADRLPVVGPVPAAGPHLWVNTALGSRGLTWALLGAELLAARLHGEPLPLPNELALAIASDRCA